MWKANPTTSIAFPLMIAAAMLAAAAAQSPGPAPVVGEAPGPYYPGAPGPYYPEAPGPYYPGAPSPALDCFPYLLNLSDCLTFVEGGSNLTKPDAGCCPELSNLVDTQPVCLCQLLGNSDQLGISVDINKALKLPNVCNVTTPPVSLCADIGYPVDGLTPTEAPSLSPGEAEAAAPPSPGGDAGSAINIASNNIASNHHFLIGLALLFLTFFF